VQAARERHRVVQHMVVAQEHGPLGVAAVPARRRGMKLG